MSDLPLEATSDISVIRAEGSAINMAEALCELWAHRELLWTWTQREIKVRYKQSILGAAWSIMQPVSMMIIFSIVFTYLVRVPTSGIPYPIFSYTALLPWTFFATSISFGASTLVNNMSLVTKIYFPREIMPLASIGAALVDYLVASVVFAGMILLYRVRIHVTIVLMPFLILIQLLFTAGIVLVLAALNVRYRDIRFVVPLSIQLWMYATPIIYPVTLVPESWQGLYMLNPMAGLIESYRAVILLGQWPEWQYLVSAFVVSVVLFVVAYRYFKRAEDTFADVI